MQRIGECLDIGSDGTLTHNVDTSLTRDELYPPEG